MEDRLSQQKGVSAPQSGCGIELGTGSGTGLPEMRGRSSKIEAGMEKCIVGLSELVRELSTRG